MMNTDSPRAAEEVGRLLVENQSMLMAYICSVIHEHDLAQQTFSDVRYTILQAGEHYDPNRPFGPWARGVARLVVMSNLRKRRRERGLLETGILEGMGYD